MCELSRCRPPTHQSQPSGQTGDAYGLLTTAIPRPTLGLTGGIGARMSDLSDVTRKLVAVFAADVEGYSRLMGTDEVGTLTGLTERRAILDKLIGDHRGRIANTALA